MSNQALSDLTPEEFEELVNSGKLVEYLQEKEKADSAVVEVAAKAEIKVEHLPDPEPTPAPPSQPIVLDEPVVEVKYKQGDEAKYAGDYEENEQAPPTGYNPAAFESPAHLLAFFSDEIISGDVKLHKWQAEVNIELAPETKPTSKNPLRYYLVASNGSGKDAFVIAPFAIWFIFCKVRSRCIITSSSGTQLTSQTETYIKSLAERINQKLGSQVFKIRQRYIRCNTSGSEIRMFATDEAGKAEGYHPMEPNAEMAIIKNESKSIAEDIHRALKRCSGFNYWLEISSPGAPVGAFYRSVSDKRMGFVGRRVTSYDCPHITTEEIEQDKIDLGEISAEFRSKHLALFTSVDGECVIPSNIFDVCKLLPPSHDFPTWPKRVGIDLAAGGDETGLCFSKGTKILKEIQFQEKDTVVATNRIELILINEGISKNHEYIFADDGGIGHAIIDNLIHRGWNIKRVRNESAAYNKKQYGNKGAELYFRFKRLVEEKVIDVTRLSDKTVEQLTTRKYKQPAGGRMFLQSKREAKAEGLHSPDRADALVLSFADLSINNFLEETNSKENDAGNRRHRMSSAEVPAFYENVTFKEYEINQDLTISASSGRKARNSISVALGLGTDNHTTESIWLK